MDPVVSSIAAYFIAWLFASAGWQKLRNQDYYENVITGYLPGIGNRAKALAQLLACVELLVATALVITEFRQVAALGAAGLLAFYLVAMAWQIVQGRADMDCGCAGPASKQPISPLLLIRNSMLMFVAGLAALPVASRSLSVADIGFMFLATVFFVLLYICLEQLTSNRALLINLRS